jgi:hypothetical protein
MSTAPQGLSNHVVYKNAYDDPEFDIKQITNTTLKSPHHFSGNACVLSQQSTLKVSYMHLHLQLHLHLHLYLYLCLYM